MMALLSSDEAAARLGVTRQTLYAYVSRGLIAPIAGGDPRRSLFAAEAVETLAARRRIGRRPREVARTTLDWGLPALPSALTAIEDGRLYYRGRDAGALAEKESIEAVAALLWGCSETAAFSQPPSVMAPGYHALLAARLDLGAEQSATERLPLYLAAATRDADTAKWQRGRDDFFAACGCLLRQVFAASLLSVPGERPLHLQIAEAWGLDAEAADLLRMALVLCADHELNASSFTARCIASTGASLRSAVIGALAALTGSLHGGATERVELFWSGIGGGDVEAAIRRRLSAGEDLPGLGHPLYPAGDIRAQLMLSRILPTFSEAAELVAAAEAITGRKVSVDFALVALRRHLRLPPGSAFAIFALGRSVGWIAQALEQWESGQLIRPRAVYVGPPLRRGER